MDDERAPDKSPRLMIFTDSPLPMAAVEQIIQTIETGGSMFFPKGVKVFQLIDGRWEPIND